MKPKFNMTSDSTKEEVKSCIAHWEFSGGAISQKFDDGKAAFAMNNVVDAAYLAGLEDGRRVVAQAVMRVAREHSA